MKYFLVGYMACGKTRTGREMADEMGMRFIDLDAYIADRERRSIPEIFAEEGEEKFRKLETRYLHEVCELYEDFVMSTGGGAACFNGNMEYMNRQGHTVFLDTPVDTIVERLIRGKHKRPIVSKLSDGEIRDFVCRHLGERRKYYEQARERR
ncbi:MAG: shikimate kinase [Odoribacter sp.]|nr:shikimate kinase [Odoribacter sp.]MDE6879026.1 shikimate kinase [Odoribacter sp.]